MKRQVKPHKVRPDRAKALRIEMEQNERRQNDPCINADEEEAQERAEIEGDDAWAMGADF